MAGSGVAVTRMRGSGPRSGAYSSVARMPKYFRFGDKNDYVVLDGGRVLGRLMRSPQAPAECSWFWAITDPDAKPFAANRGYSATREEAKANFKEQLSRITAAE